MLFDRKYVDITVFYLANSIWSALWWCNSSRIMFAFFVGGQLWWASASTGSLPLSTLLFIGK